MPCLGSSLKPAFSSLEIMSLERAPMSPVILPHMPCPSVLRFEGLKVVVKDLKRDWLLRLMGRSIIPSLSYPPILKAVET